MVKQIAMRARSGERLSRRIIVVKWVMKRLGNEKEVGQRITSWLEDMDKMGRKVRGGSGT